MSMEVESREQVAEAINRLVDEYRHQCLWFLREDFYPVTDVERRRILAYIQRYGDQAAFRRAAQLQQWLSPDSSATSASS